VNETVQKLLALVQGGSRNRGMFSAIVASWSVASLAQVVDERTKQLAMLDAAIQERQEELESLEAQLRRDADDSQPTTDPTAEDSRPEGVRSDLEEDEELEPFEETLKVSGRPGDLPMIQR
jgi:hypothetical protein